MIDEEVTFSPQRVLQSSPEAQTILRVDVTQSLEKLMEKVCVLSI
jgi:hypothetical protein